MCRVIESTGIYYEEINNTTICLIGEIRSGILYLRRRCPASKKNEGRGNKLISGGVQSPSEVYAPRGCARICRGRPLKRSQIRRQVSRARLEYKKMLRNNGEMDIILGNNVTWIMQEVTGYEQKEKE